MARTRGYWIAHIDVDDVALYREFTESVSETIARHGRAFPGSRRKRRVAEGRSRTRHAILEFPSYEDAVACYESLALTHDGAPRLTGSERDIVIVEGYDGPQFGAA